jgi:predicted amidohydrolase
VCAAFGAPAPPPQPTTCAIDVAGHAGSVRVFAVGNLQNVAQDVDYARYCDAIDRVMRERVAPCLRSGAPNLVVFPENATLAAWFVGARGDQARTRTEASRALADLASTYDPAIGWYRSRFTTLDDARLLDLALTDTSWRVLDGVFAGIAKHYGVYVAVGADVSGAQTTTDESAIERIGDPSASGPTYAASSPEVWNASVVFSPDGALVGFEKKAYLTDDEATSRSLSYGPLAALDPIPLPFARIGVAISNDAWSPLVRDRFEAWGVDLVLQHEASDGWAIADRPADWLPDVQMESGWAMTHRAGTVRAVITPMLTGNFFDRVLDGQTHATKISEPDDTPLGFIGNASTNGFFAVAPWADATDTDRFALRAYGESLQPGGSREDAYVDGVVAVDLDLHDDGIYPSPSSTSAPSVPGIFGPSLVMASSSTPQRHVAITARGTHAYAAWEEGAPGGGDIRVASFAGGVFAPPQTISSGHARLPSIAIFDPGEVTVGAAWEQDSLDGKTNIYVGKHTEGEPWSAGAIASAGAPQWAPWVAGTRFDGLYLGWHDLRDDGRSHVYVSHLGSGTFGLQVRVDPAHVDPTPLGDEWSLRMVADDRALHVAWIDHRDASWDVRYATSIDQGMTFSTPVRINDATMFDGTPAVELERIESDVAIALDLGGAALVGWTAMQERKPFPWVAWDHADGLGNFGLDTALGLGDDVVQPAMAVDAAGKVHVVAVKDGAIVLDAPWQRVSDAPAGAHATRPRMTVVGDATVLIAWEDDREGPTKIRYVVGTLP